jgi:AcrR family transcriptional regulator
MERHGSSVSGVNLRERHKEATRRELRAAAFELFDRNGYAQTSVDQIAAAAGVSRSTFFRYFRNKEDVLALDNRQGALLFLELLRGRPPEEGSMKALEETTIAFAHERRSDERREEIVTVERIVMADSALSAARAGLVEQWREEVAKVLAERAGRGEPDVEDALASAILVQMVDLMGIRWRATDPGVATTDLIRSFFAALRRLVTDLPPA